METVKQKQSSFLGKLNIKSAIKKIDDHFEWAKGTEWIQDPRVICCEYLIGTKVQVEVESVPSPYKNERGVLKPRILEVRTRKSTFWTPMADQRLVEPVLEAWNNGLIPHEEGKYVGTIVTDYAKGPMFIPLTRNFTRMQYSSWHKGPKTVESLERWLYEDLLSHCGHRYGQVLSFNPKDEIRPNGLIFYHPETKQIAKVTVYQFPWNEMEKNFNFTNKTVQHAYNLERKRVIQGFTDHI
jgi:hypothetical protein